MRKYTPLDECIKWNRRKAKDTNNARDKARYEQNIADLLLYKEKDDG